jgi:hypothetical protein
MHSVSKSQVAKAHEQLFIEHKVFYFAESTMQDS